MQAKARTFHGKHAGEYVGGERAEERRTVARAVQGSERGGKAVGSGSAWKRIRRLQRCASTVASTVKQGEWTREREEARRENAQRTRGVGREQNHTCHERQGDEAPTRSRRCRVHGGATGCTMRGVYARQMANRAETGSQQKDSRESVSSGQRKTAEKGKERSRKEKNEGTRSWTLPSNDGKSAVNGRKRKMRAVDGWPTWPMWPTQRQRQRDAEVVTQKSKTACRGRVLVSLLSRETSNVTPSTERSKPPRDALCVSRRLASPLLPPLPPAHLRT